MSLFTCFAHVASLHEEILLIFVYCITLNLKLSPDHCRLLSDLSCICCRSEHEVSGWGHIPMSWSCLESSRCFPPAAFPQLLHLWSLPISRPQCFVHQFPAVLSSREQTQCCQCFFTVVCYVISFVLFSFKTSVGEVFTRGQTVPSCSALPFSNWIVIPLETAPVTVPNDPWTITLEIQF